MLPPAILNRPKHGFTPPLEAWFAGRLGIFAREVLLDASCRLASRVNRAVVRELVAEPVRSASQAHKVWALLVYELWSRRYGVA